MLAPLGTAFALFGAWMIPLTLTIPIISAALFFRFLPPAPERRHLAHLGPEMRSYIVRFAVFDATGGLFTQTWTYLLPILITSSLGGRVNALFFSAFLFSSTIDQVSADFASPLTVEGAHAPEEMPRLIRSALRHIFGIILPLVVALIIVSPWLLRAFGDQYVGAVPLLDLLLIACLPKAVSTIYYAYCRVERQTHKSATMQAFVCVATLATVVLIARPFGLIGVGLAILAVQSFAAAVSWWALRRGQRRVPHRRGRQGRWMWTGWQR
jgi:O-antigen/teichoic acid export membrane protein